MGWFRDRLRKLTPEPDPAHHLWNTVTVEVFAFGLGVGIRITCLTTGASVTTALPRDGGVHLIHALQGALQESEVAH